MNLLDGLRMSDALAVIKSLTTIEAISKNPDLVEQLKENSKNILSAEDCEIFLEGLERFKTDAKFRKLVMKEYFKKS